MIDIARSVFITGTDTGVGKTHVAVTLLQQWARQGLKVAGRLIPEESAAWRPAGAVVASLAASLAALIGVGPLIAYYFVEVPLLGLGTNVLAVPAMTPVMWA